MRNFLRAFVLSLGFLVLSSADAADAPANCECTTAIKVTIRKAGDRAAQAVSVVDFAFNASTLNVAVGDTVTWTNNGGTGHTVSSDTAGLFDSGTLSPGQTFSFTFPTAGSFAYHCNIHPSMTGTVVAKAADGGAPGAVDVSGTWNGKGKGKVFNLAGTDPKAGSESLTFSATLTQSATVLTAQMTFSETFTLSGQIGNGSFWLSGPNAASTKTVVVSGHVSKKGDTIKGAAIIYGAQSSEEMTFSMKK